MYKAYRTAIYLQAIFNPLIGLWNFMIPHYPEALAIITFALNVLFVSLAGEFPIAGLIYVALFALNTVGFSIDSAQLASNTSPETWKRTHTSIFGNYTSSVVHFLTGALFITAASLVFALCPNPLVPMKIIAGLSGLLNYFYLDASALHSSLTNMLQDSIQRYKTISQDNQQPVLIRKDAMEKLESISAVTLDLTDLCSVYSNTSIFSATLSEKGLTDFISAHLVAFRPELSILSNDDLNSTLPKP